MHGMCGEDGKSPRVSASGTWEVWDGSTWVDTGIAAGVDETTIAAAVGEYLDEHPITVTETDPTVPEWAKNPTKPTYTAQEVGALPADTPIPDAVTEQTVSGWGFTKNTGDYTKPSTGIPKSDLAADVQTSLGKADTALQQHQSLAGYATETYVQQQIAAIPDKLPAVTATDNGKFLRVVSGAWSAQALTDVSEVGA